MRGRNNHSSSNNNNNNNNRRNHNPLTRVYESNGPDVKIRGTANHVAEKYLQLARDAQTSSDPIAAENYFQHAEHYFRLIAAAQEQFRQQNPNFQPPRPEGGGNDQQFQPRNDDGADEGDDGTQSFGDAPFNPREPQPYLPRDAQPFVPREQQAYQPREQRNGPQDARQERPPQERSSQERSSQDRAPQERPPQPRPQNDGQHHEALPAFITGGATQPVPQQADQAGPNGYENGQPDRFPLHRRRRRHRGPRDGQAPQGDDRPDDSGT